MAVTATIVINFGQGIDIGGAIAELAADLNNDKSTFAPGEPCFFRLFGPPDMVVDNIATSAGDVLFEGVETVQRSDVITFADRDNLTANLSVPPSSALAVSWWGSQPVDFAIAGSQVVVSEDLLPIIGSAEYSAMPRLYQLQPPAMQLAAGDEYPIVIMIEVSMP